MFAVLMLVMVSRYLQKVESLKADKSQVLKSNMKTHKYDSVEVWKLLPTFLAMLLQS